MCLFNMAQLADCDGACEIQVQHARMGAAPAGWACGRSPAPRGGTCQGHHLRQLPAAGPLVHGLPHGLPGLEHLQGFRVFLVNPLKALCFILPRQRELCNWPDDSSSSLLRSVLILDLMKITSTDDQPQQASALGIFASRKLQEPPTERREGSLNTFYTQFILPSFRSSDLQS